jgi:hypothetical protein
MAYSQIEVNEYAHRLGKSERTLWRWIKKGCNLRDPKSVREWVTRNEIRKTNIARARERRGKESVLPIAGKHLHEHQAKPQTRFEPPGNGETLPPPGRCGAAAALERLELAEERAHARLQITLERGDPLAINAAQTFWLKCSETLRRLDLKEARFNRTKG